jgi:hypothetical protein
VIISDETWTSLLEVRATRPNAIAETLVQRRRRRPLLGSDGRLLLLAADHTARAAVEVGEDPIAMADRRDLLGRLAIALSNPAVDGLLGSADIIEELALLGQLQERVVLGTMNRGGLVGSAWELDDRMTAYSPEEIVDAGLDGGKILLRIDDDDPATIGTIVACANATSGLARSARLAVIEPLPWRANRFDGSTDRLVRAVGVASGLGHTSAYTWLALPVTDGLATAVAATSLPVLARARIPGGDLGGAVQLWQRALAIPNVRGLVAGRELLYPPDGDVAGAVAAAARLVHGGTARG